jgi:DNA modification methylase
MAADNPDCRVIHGEALAVLKTLDAGSVTAVVTDPPYGTDVPRDGYGRRDRQKHIAGDSDLSTLAAVLPEFVRVLRPDSWCLVFCSPKRRWEAESLIRASGLNVRGEVVWDEVMPGLGAGIRYRHETVLLAAVGRPAGNAPLMSVVRHPWGFNGNPRAHPHQKPIDLMRELVRYACPPGDFVLDPFAGSFTTGVACAREGRRFIGIEIDEGYVAVARRRIAEATRTVPPSGLFAHLADT